MATRRPRPSVMSPPGPLRAGATSAATGTGLLMVLPAGGPLRSPAPHRESFAIRGCAVARLRAGVASSTSSTGVLLMLSDYAGENGGAPPLRFPPPFAARLLELLPASYLRLAEAGAEA